MKWPAAPCQCCTHVSTVSGRRTSPAILGRHQADANLDPGGPGSQAINKQQRKVGYCVAAVSLDPSCPRPGAHAGRGRHAQGQPFNRQGQGQAQGGGTGSPRGDAAALHSHAGNRHRQGSRQRRLFDGKCNGAQMGPLVTRARARDSGRPSHLGSLSNRTDSGLDGCSTRVRYAF